MIHTLCKEYSYINDLLSEMRDEKIQQDSLRFRKNVERFGILGAYEISKTLKCKEISTTTVLGEAPCNVLKEQPVVVSILRAGLPLHNGVIDLFDRSQNAFISAYRRHHKDDSFEIEIEYLSSPSVEGKTVILCDPMLATGSSMVLAYKALLERGKPEKVHVLAVIASEQGVQFVRKNLPEGTEIWVGDIDKELTAHAYIVPGLGDAGDLAYGSKV